MKRVVEANKQMQKKETQADMLFIASSSLKLSLPVNYCAYTCLQSVKRIGSEGVKDTKVRLVT